jgi:uncharacterized damage-inducible protein DinB
VILSGGAGREAESDREEDNLQSYKVARFQSAPPEVNQTDSMENETNAPILLRASLVQAWPRSKRRLTLIAHEAHCRGQIAMLARQAGHAIPQKAMFGMREWGMR